MSINGPWHIGGVGGCRPHIIYDATGLAVLRTWCVRSESDEAEIAVVAAAAPEMLVVLRNIAGIRLDGEEGEDGEEESMDIGDAFRLLSEAVECAREVIARFDPGSRP